MVAGSSSSTMDEADDIDIDDDHDHNLDDVKLLGHVLDWARTQQGSFISRKVEIRAITDNLVGLYANERIHEREIILSTPWSAILRPPDIDDDNDEGSASSWWCKPTDFVRAAITKQSHLQTPYEKYLSRRSRKSIPRFWSLPGRTLLRQLMEPSFSFNFGLEDELDSNYWKEEENCTTPFDDEYHLNAMMLLQTRGEGSDGIDLIPIHDLLNHRNGNHTNARPIYVPGSKYLVVAQRDIDAGEQLQNSYNRCDWCTRYRNPSRGAEKFMVTPQLFESYGFVESMPQRWVIPERRLLFDIDEKPGSSSWDGHPPFHSLEVTFLVPPSRAGFDFLRRQVPFLREFHRQHRSRSDVPAHELEAILSFRDAMEVAYSVAVAQSYGKMSEQVWEWDEENWYLENDEEDDDEEEEKSDDGDDGDDDEDSDDKDDSDDEDDDEVSINELEVGNDNDQDEDVSIHSEL